MIGVASVIRCLITFLLRDLGRCARLARPQKLNPYSYSLNSPIVRIDPSGTDDIAGWEKMGSSLTLGAGAVLGGVALATAPAAVAVLGGIAVVGAGLGAVMGYIVGGLEATRNIGTKDAATAYRVFEYMSDPLGSGAATIGEQFARRVLDTSPEEAEAFGEILKTAVSLPSALKEVTGHGAKALIDIAEGQVKGLSSMAELAQAENHRAALRSLGPTTSDPTQLESLPATPSDPAQLQSPPETANE